MTMRRTESEEIVKRHRVINPPSPGMEWILEAAGVQTTGDAAALDADPTRWARTTADRIIKEIARVKKTRAWKALATRMAKLENNPKHKAALKRMARLQAEHAKLQSEIAPTMKMIAELQVKMNKMLDVQ